MSNTCHESGRDPNPARATSLATIALAGQPNVGKSTVFNMLTGLNQHVGNWPGKTVEQRSGTFEHDGVCLEIVDLPGTYSLTAASPEEMVARDYIIQHKPAVVLVVINAASLERNLYLVAELLALPAPLVIGLNMMDVARQEGFEIDPQTLARTLGVPVIPMTATRNQGVHELIDAALEVIRHGPVCQPSRPAIREDHRQVYDQLRAIIQDHVPDPYPSDWVALKLLEGDQEITALMRHTLPAAQWSQIEAMQTQHEDTLIAVASGRYDWIRRMTHAALQRPRAGQITLTQRLDRVATHPFGGLMTLATVLAVIFGLTYAVGGPLQKLIATYIVGGLAQLATRLLAGGPAWLTGLVVDGILGGAGTMLTFLPILAIFFAAMGLMEDVGYMARSAYVMDRFMHAVGLHGKSFMPLFLGFGCNVPAIMGARIIESRRSQILTIMLAPLVPCAARLGVLVVLVPAFFPGHATLVAWALTGLPLVVLALVGGIASRFVLKGEDAALIMEMPLYHVPNWRTIGIVVWKRLEAFLERAGTIILVVSVIVWALATLPYGNIETSLLASVGRLLEPIGALMGLGWKPLVALLTSFVAKENAVATLGVLYGAGENTGALLQALAGNLSPASGLAFLVAEMLFIPCVSTVAVIKQETNSWKWPLINITFLAGLTLLAGTITYRLALLVL
jgi:ferrous iron transport protein B